MLQSRQVFILSPLINELLAREAYSSFVLVSWCPQYIIPVLLITLNNSTAQFFLPSNQSSVPTDWHLHCLGDSERLSPASDNHRVIHTVPFRACFPFIGSMIQDETHAAESETLTEMWGWQQYSNNEDQAMDKKFIWTNIYVYEMTLGPVKVGVNMMT